jgi:hypothetical protein
MMRHGCRLSRRTSSFPQVVVGQADNFNTTSVEGRSPAGATSGLFHYGYNAGHVGHASRKDAVDDATGDFGLSLEKRSRPQRRYQPKTCQHVDRER